MPDLSETTTTNNHHPQKASHWGFWSTLIFSIIIFAVFSVLQLVIIIIAAVTNGSLDVNALQHATPEEQQSILANLVFNGDLLGIAEIPSTLIGVGLVFLVIWFRKTLSFKQYTALKAPEKPITTTLKWLALLLIVLMGMGALSEYMDHGTSEFMTKIYGSSENKILLWIAVGVAAPIFEEILFRGFMLEGLRRTWLGNIGSVVFIAALFAMIHFTQYGWFELSLIFVVALLFGAAKVKTGSLYVPIAMHMFMNLSSSLMMEFEPSLQEATTAIAVLL